ncbi:carboxypeptidase regulatory-like domain-containing protein [Rathayibacter sp. VKM Ac-2835]|uniref:carboxypeptidase regulatory-like domain-containing protein n=1 Tax=Rathayibacter sp. VKM Ac-2835 TaxID=2739043 RepID=UPI00156402BB|nr:carboxypeptidase regulatory-like domain-containing protein [Rathayibacter sp. VKM Ac-2835]NRG43031.1 carboxypeptidase regulatory-like domain-containing protein [Rathayibacter sp. VKM Ac-2835]
MKTFARPLAALLAPILAGSMILAIAPTASAAPLSAYIGFTDKSALEASGRAVVASGSLAVTTASVPVSTGTSYFVDSDGGDDTAAGTSAATAWKTLTRVNETVFSAGDHILLKAGSSWTASGSTVAKEAYDYTTWSGTTPTDVTGPDATAFLAPRGSGTAENPIVLSSYGNGAAPELNGRGVVNDVLQLTNQQHWDISNLEISNVADGFNPAKFEPGLNQGLKAGEENPRTGDLRGIHVQGENAGTLSGYDIHNVFIHDVSGVIWSIGNTGLDRSKRTGGILFEGLKGDGRTVSQFSDVTVRDSIVANTSFANVSFKQFSGMGENRYKDVKPGWGDRAAGKASNTGVITEDPDWRPHTDVNVTDNYLTNRNTAYGWDSLYLTSVQHATVENNMIDGTGVSGIEMYYADDVLVQNNEVAEVEVRVNAADSNAIDPDRGTSNILIQGNYLHDSGEGVLLCGFSFSTAVVRYNVIQDVDRNYVNPHGDSGVNVIYNNLMYNTQKPLKNNTIGFFESSGSASDFLLDKNRHYLYNNVFQNARADVAGAQFQSTMPGVTFSNNSYSGPKVTAVAADPRAITGDPKIAGNPADAVSNAAIAAADSPLISAGTTVDLSKVAPGFAVTGASDQSRLPLTVDFFGTGIGTPPNVGPTSYQPATGQALITGTVAAADGVAVPGALVTYGAQTVTAGPDGRYAIEAAPGSYTLIPSAGGYADGAPVAVSPTAGETIRRDLTLGATTSTVGTITGTVTSAGQPLTGATVTLTTDGQEIATQSTDAAGAYRFTDIPQGSTYTLTATKDGLQSATQSGIVVTAARTATVNLVLPRTNVPTEYALNETFDGEPTGDFTATTDGALVSKTAPAVGTISIVDDAADAGNKYLRLNKSSTSAGVLSVYNPTELNLTGVVTIESRVKRTTSNTSANQVAMYSFTEKDWNATNPASSTSPSATFGLSAGKIMTHNVTGSSTIKNVANYAVGQWYTVREVVDLDAKTFDFYLDDMTTPVLTDQPLRTAVDDLDYFQIFTNGSNVGDMLVDYLRVNTGAPYGYGDAGLSSATAVSDGADVALTASEDGLGYSGTVAPFAETATIAAAPASPFATVSVDGTTVPNGQPVEIDLATGSNDDTEFVTIVPVVVTAEDGTQRSYTVSLAQTNPNQLRQLRDLAVTGSELSPAFAPGRQGEENPYLVQGELPATTGAVTLSWRRGWSGQQVQVNGLAVAADATQATVPIVAGENTIEVSVDSYPGDFGTYVLTLTRAAAAPALDVDVATSSRCIAGKSVLTATVTNASTVPVTVALTSVYGSKTFAPIAPGKSAVQAFTTRLSTMPAGTVEVAATGTVAGSPVSLSESAPYTARSC